jgi:hypothetical protein
MEHARQYKILPQNPSPPIVSEGFCIGGRVPLGCETKFYLLRQEACATAKAELRSALQSASRAFQAAAGRFVSCPLAGWRENSPKGLDTSNRDG